MEPNDRSVQLARLARVSLETGIRQEEAGQTEAADVAFQAAWRHAVSIADPAVESEALRRLAVLRHHQNRHADAISMARLSRDAALLANDAGLLAEALNALAGMYVDRGELALAAHLLLEARDKATNQQATLGKVEQNLGIVASVQGRVDEALEHYGRAMAAFAACGDDRGRAVSYNNLGLACIDRNAWTEAEMYFGKAIALAESVQDQRLIGIGHLNRAELLVGQKRHESARESVDLARSYFNRIGSLAEEADAYHVAGRIYRATGRHHLAATMLETAVDLAHRSRALLCEAECCRDLAEVYGDAGRTADRDNLLARSKELFTRLAATVQLRRVDERIAELARAA